MQRGVRVHGRAWKALLLAAVVCTVAAGGPLCAQGAGDGGKVGPGVGIGAKSAQSPASNSSTSSGVMAARATGTTVGAGSSTELKGSMAGDSGVRGGSPRGSDSRGADMKGADARGSDATQSMALVQGGFLWRWWDLNRLGLLLPGDVFALADEPAPLPAASRSSPVLSAEDCKVARVLLLPRLFRALGDPDPLVRVAAATAAGRIGGELAVPYLRAMLSDRVQSVRESALLALGATGAPQAAPFLLELASRAPVAATLAPMSPAAQDAWRDDPSPDTDALAWVALGLGRQRGFSDGLGRFLVDLAGELSTDRQHDLATATLLYQRLSPADDFMRLGAGRMADPGQQPELRARAAESLGALADPSMIPCLHAALEDSDLQLRRSAALALASFRSAPLLADLATHLVAEQDELLRGYLLLAIANQDPGPAAVTLTATLRTGDAIVRPWAALALGLLARREPAVAAASASTLRTEATRCHSVEDTLAFVLASGLARDGGRADEFVNLLEQSSDGRTRLVATQALTLLGVSDVAHWDRADEVRQAVSGRLSRETDPLARGALAESLAMHHDVRDVPVLVQALGAVHAGEPVADLARGCGAHRTRELLDALSDIVEDAARKPAVRAAAWESIGLLLDADGRSRLPEAIAGTDLDTLPSWCERLLAQSTL